MSGNTDIRMRKLADALLMLKNKEHHTLFYTNNSIISTFKGSPAYFDVFLYYNVLEKKPAVNGDKIFGIDMASFQKPLLTEEEARQKALDFMQYYFQYDGVKGNRVPINTGEYLVFDRGRYKVLAYTFSKESAYRQTPVRMSAIALFDEKKHKFIIPGRYVEHPDKESVVFDRFNNIIYIADRSNKVLQIFSINEDSVDVSTVRGDIYISTFLTGYYKYQYRAQVEVLVYNRVKPELYLYTGYNGKLQRILISSARAVDRSNGNASIVQLLQHPEYKIHRWSFDMFSKKDWDLALEIRGEDFSNIHYPVHKFHIMPVSGNKKYQEVFKYKNMHCIETGDSGSTSAHALLASKGSFQIFRDNAGVYLHYAIFEDGKPKLVISSVAQNRQHNKNAVVYDAISRDIDSVAYIGDKHFYIFEYLSSVNAVNNAFVGIYNRETGQKVHEIKSSPWRLLLTTRRDPGRYIGLIHRQVNNKGIGRFMLFDTETLKPLLTIALSNFYMTRSFEKDIKPFKFLVSNDTLSDLRVIQSNGKILIGTFNHIQFRSDSKLLKIEKGRQIFLTDATTGAYRTEMKHMVFTVYYYINVEKKKVYSFVRPGKESVLVVDNPYEFLNDNLLLEKSATMEAQGEPYEEER